MRDLVAPEYLPQGDYEFSDYLVDYTDDAGFIGTNRSRSTLFKETRDFTHNGGFFTIHGEDIRPLDKIVPPFLKGWRFLARPGRMPTSSCEMPE